MQEILLDMGIKVMGDILCILKHAKKVRKMQYTLYVQWASWLPGQAGSQGNCAYTPFT